MRPSSLRSGLLAATVAVASSWALSGDDGAPRRSGFEDMGPSTQAMQRDDRQNPGMLWNAEGEGLWQQRVGSTNKSCASCHGDISSMRGAAVLYPRYDERSQRGFNLGMRINACRERHQLLPPWTLTDHRLLSLETAVAYQSRGMPITPDPDPRLTSQRQKGEQLFKQRMGQLNLSCTQCHDQLAGGLLGGTLIPQGHATGYPTYRLEWQGLGNLQRRLRNCLSGVRAQGFSYGSEELVALELHLARRAAGMKLETPAVRP